MELDDQMHGHFYLYGQHDEYYGSDGKFSDEKKVPSHFTWSFIIYLHLNL